MEKHLKAHEVQTLYCPLCSVAFTHKSLLKIHMKAKCGVKSTDEETLADDDKSVSLHNSKSEFIDENLDDRCSDTNKDDSESDDAALVDENAVPEASDKEEQTKQLPINFPLLAQLQSSLPLITLLQLQQQQQQQQSQKSLLDKKDQLAGIKNTLSLLPAAMLQANLLSQIKKQQVSQNNLQSLLQNHNLPSTEIKEEQPNKNEDELESRIKIKEEFNAKPEEETDSRFDLGGGLSIYPLNSRNSDNSENNEDKTMKKPKNIPEHLFKLLQLKNKMELNDSDEEEETKVDKEPESMQDQILSIIRSQEDGDLSESEKISSVTKTNSDNDIKDGKDMMGISYFYI